MSRQDFQLIAETISAIADLRVRREVAELFAASLRRSNARFDADRFIAVSMGERSR